MICIKKDIKINNLVDVIEIVEKLLDRRMTAMRREYRACGEDSVG